MAKQITLKKPEQIKKGMKVWVENHGIGIVEYISTSYPWQVGINFGGSFTQEIIPDRVYDAGHVGSDTKIVILKFKL